MEKMTASSTTIQNQEQPEQPEQPQEPKPKAKAKREKKDILAEIKALEEKKQALLAQHKKAETRKKIIIGGLMSKALEALIAEEKDGSAAKILAKMQAIAADKDREIIDELIKKTREKIDKEERKKKFDTMLLSA